MHSVLLLVLLLLTTNWLLLLLLLLLLLDYFQLLPNQSSFLGLLYSGWFSKTEHLGQL